MSDLALFAFAGTNAGAKTHLVVGKVKILCESSLACLAALGSSTLSQEAVEARSIAGDPLSLAGILANLLLQRTVGLRAICLGRWGCLEEVAPGRI